MNYLYLVNKGRSILAGFLVLMAGGLWAQSGMIDSTFGNNGVVLTDINMGSSDGATSVLVQADGKIVVAGYTRTGNQNDFAMARFLDDGSLDPGFGAGGIVQTDLGGNERIQAALLDENQKIVVTGYSGDDFVTARYLPDGSLDETFGADGIVYTDFFNGPDYANALILQADGKIVAGGYSFNPSDTSNYPAGDGFALARFNPNGSLDPTFGDQGKVFTQFGADYEEIFSLALQSDGKIIAGGFTFDGVTEDRIALARYDPDGALDPAFGSGGMVVDSFSSETAGARWTGLFPDGRIIVAGRAGNSNFENGLAMYLADGTPDSTFNDTGKFVLPPEAKCQAILSGAVMADGKIMIAGFGQIGNFTTAHFFLGKINPDGRVDTTFGDNGFVTKKVTSVYSQAYAIAPTADGNLVLAGEASTPGGNGVDFALLKYLNGLQVSTRQVESPAREIKVYPNPLVSDAMLSYELHKEQPITIRLLDPTGRVLSVFVQDQWQAPGSYQQPVAIPAALPSGFYFIQIASPQGQISIKVVK